MTDISPLLPKIEPLVRMLASDHDHEALSAVRALGRVLLSGDASFHDLADALNRPSPPDDREDAYWRRPQRRYAGSADFVAPRRSHRPPPKPAGPPLWEALNKAAKMAWLTRVAECERLTLDQRTAAGQLRAQFFSQPHRSVKPAQAAAINAVFFQAWIQDVRPIEDVRPGDARLPLRWTGTNRELVRVVLSKAAPYLSDKDAQFARSAAHRIEINPHAFVEASNDELERLERLLVESYDLGARP